MKELGGTLENSGAKAQRAAFRCLETQEAASSEKGTVEDGTTRFITEGLGSLGIPEDVWLEIDQGQINFWQQLYVTADRRRRDYDVEDILIRYLHVDQTKMTRYTQWTRLKSFTKFANMCVWYRQLGLTRLCSVCL